MKARLSKLKAKLSDTSTGRPTHQRRVWRNVFQVAFNPVNYQGIGAVDDLDDVTYTIVTAGRRHIKFWSLYRETPDSRTKTMREKDTRDMQSRDKRQTMRRKGGLAGTGQKEWKLEGNTGGFGRAGKLQDIRLPLELVYVICSFVVI